MFTFKRFITVVLVVVLFLFIMTASSKKAEAQTGVASWYGGHFHGKLTANGERFNKWAMTTASNSHKMGTRLRVTNVDNGKSVVVKVNDTGGFKKYGRLLDLSRGAFSKIANVDRGTVKVKVSVIK